MLAFRSKTNWSHGKGKGQGQQSQPEVKCFRCNEQGRYAKDCTARMVDVGQVHEAPQASSSRTLVFDMRGGGLDKIDEVRVINYSIGDEESCVRAVIEELDTEELEEEIPTTTIILDSGADAPVIPGPVTGYTIEPAW